MKNKFEVASFLKQKMLKKQFRIYYDPDVIANLNVECFDLAKTGETIFSHPQNTRDDIVWAIVLAAAASMLQPAPPKTHSYQLLRRVVETPASLRP